MMIAVKNLKVVNLCWECGKAHDDVPYSFTARDKTVKCDACVGNVVSKTGKVRMTLISAIPVFVIDDGETHRWAAKSAEEAKAAHIEMYGELDEEATITQITDPIEFNRRFILPEEQNRVLKSINDVVSEIEEFPALISSSVW
ncbi:hypothetical protein [Paenibacillus sp. IHBB 3054]|uniref:hypothetical protein n=1 Tax=Paenibacillus sp. IHBB 3054 TaxID=3425689 RepID=UPI003F660F9B